MQSLSDTKYNVLFLHSQSKQEIGITILRIVEQELVLVAAISSLWLLWLVVLSGTHSFDREPATSTKDEAPRNRGQGLLVRPLLLPGTGSGRKLMFFFYFKSTISRVCVAPLLVRRYIYVPDEKPVPPKDASYVPAFSSSLTSVATSWPSMLYTLNETNPPLVTLNRTTVEGLNGFG
ncbi:MAG: hypothetical protein HW407_1562 [Bacteroidetes bacterium]|nr:hypothetical protein [Bacteroidota bacterium]